MKKGCGCLGCFFVFCIICSIFADDEDTITTDNTQEQVQNLAVDETNEIIDSNEAIETNENNEEQEKVQINNNPNPVPLDLDETHGLLLEDNWEFSQNRLRFPNYNTTSKYVEDRTKAKIIAMIARTDNFITHDEYVLLYYSIDSTFFLREISDEKIKSFISTYESGLMTRVYLLAFINSNCNVKNVPANIDIDLIQASKTFSMNTGFLKAYEFAEYFNVSKDNNQTFYDENPNFDFSKHYDFHGTGSILYKYDGVDEIAIIPEGITAIGYNAFKDNKFVKKVVIPDSVTNISRYAFTGCVNLEEVVLSKNITSIKVGTFENCSSLKEIYIPQNVSLIENDAFRGCVSLTSISIPNNVTFIGNNAFDGCQNLEKVALSNNLTSINVGTFQNCSSLNEIYIPSTVSVIDDKAFKDCSSLTSINIPNSVTRIGEEAFSGCKTLKELNIPESVTWIGKAAFYWCLELEKVNLFAKITEINEYTFGACVSMPNITIPETVTSISNQAFGSCSALTETNILSENISFVDSELFIIPKQDQFFVYHNYLPKDLKINIKSGSLTENTLKKAGYSEYLVSHTESVPYHIHDIAVAVDNN